MNAMQLLTDHLALWSSADTEKKSGRGRASGNAARVYGIKKLRELILELAVRGKLVPQDETDEPASELLKRIDVEKAKLIADGKIKKSKPLAEITNDEKPFELPNGWEWVKLGTVSQKLTDGSHNPPKDTGSGFPMLSSQNINFGKVDFDSPSRFVTEGDFQIENARTKIEVNDVLLTIVGSLGRAAVVPVDAPKFVLQRSVAVIRTDLLPEFLCIQFGAPFCVSYFNLNGKGTAQKGIYLGQLSEMPIIVPPLAEQHRIVAKVDELMALCDQLENQHADAIVAHEKLASYLLDTLTHSQNATEFTENWQRIAANFETLFTTESTIDSLKQTLLQLAVMGKLVPQDANDEPASELLKRIQNEKVSLVTEGKIKKPKSLELAIENSFVLPRNWVWVQISDLAQLVTSGSRDWSQYLSDEGAKFVTMGNLSRGGYNLRLENMRYVNPPTSGEGSRTKLEPLDLLISITGDVGNLGRVPEGFGEAYINQHTCLVRFLPLCRNRYFPEALRSPMASIQFNAPQRGIKNSFRLSDVGEMIIPLPPLAEQHRIVAKLDELMTLCDTIKSCINNASQLQQKIADILVDNSLTNKPTNSQAVKNNILEFQLNQNDDYRLLVLAAEITFQLQGESTYGHLKLQKLVYLCQQIRNMALPTNFFRAAAGPYDREMAHYIDGEFLKRGWFDYDKERKPKYRQLESCGEHQADFNKYFGSEAKNIYHLIGLFRTNLSECIEIVATLFACWKDIITANESVTDDLLLERFYAWSDEKRKFQNNQVLDMLEWMRTHSIAPLSLEK